MKLTNMKLTEAEQKAMFSPSLSEGPDRPLYPWGLSINLDTAALEKIGLECEVGETYTLTASVDCTACSSNESEGGKSRSATLQITAMRLDEEADGDDSGKQEKLYGGKGGA